MPQSAAARISLKIAGATTVVALAMAAQTASAQDSRGLKRSGQLDQLISCRSIADDAQRLACYDRESASFAEAESKGDIIVADRQDLEKVREEAFGYSVGDNPLLRDKDGKPLDKLVSTITSARANASGKWTIKLENGTTWAQTDTERLRRRPAPGMSIEIEKALLGSYNAKIEGQRFIKVRRVD